MHVLNYGNSCGIFVLINWIEIKLNQMLNVKRNSGGMLSI